MVGLGALACSPITILLVATRATSDQNTRHPHIEGALIQEVIRMLVRSEKGQGLAEYALILALIAIVAVIALVFLSGAINNILSTVGNSL